MSQHNNYMSSVALRANRELAIEIDRIHLATYHSKYTVPGYTRAVGNRVLSVSWY